MMIKSVRMLSIVLLAASLPLIGQSDGLASDRMNINPNAATLARTEVFIDAPPSAVWSTLTDVNRWTDWIPEIDAARIDGPLAPGSIIYWKPQGQVVESRIVLVEPGRKLVWNGTDGAVHVWQIIPQGKGTLLKNDESIENWRLAGTAANSSTFLSKTLNAWNKRIAEHVAN